MFRYLILFASLNFVLGTAFADEAHLVFYGDAKFAPISKAKMKQQIEKAADTCQKFAPVPRVGFYDVAYPANEAETKRMKGNAVLLVTSISQDKLELPLKRVYIEFDGTSIDLTQIGSASSIVPKLDELVRTTFGQNRVDALYLLPIRITSKKGVLLADFARNRKGFKLAEFNGNDISYLKSWENPSKDEGMPTEKILTDFIRREYPCFIVE